MLTSKTTLMYVGVSLAVVALAMRIPQTREFVLG